jgi:outer membrane lipoprotein-sorting protein
MGSGREMYMAEGNNFFGNQKLITGVRVVLSVFIIPVFLMTTFNILSADEGIDKVLKGVIERYKGLPGLSVNYQREIVTKSMAMLGDDVKSDIARGVFLFMPPHYLKVQQDSPTREFIFADNESMYWYIPEDKVAYQYPVNKLGKELGILSDLFMGMINIEKDFEVILEASENKDSYSLKLIPRETWEELDYVRIAVDRDKYYILTVEIVNFIGSITRFKLDEFKERDDLTGDFFRFSVPQGVEVIKE